MRAYQFVQINEAADYQAGKAHLDHPEDRIFLGGALKASEAVDAIVATARNPENITIKWDGFPALIFGRDEKNRFSIMDKHMFDKKDGSGRKIYSPQDFANYDIARGVNRIGLHQAIARIWPGLKKEDIGPGYYWADMLFAAPLKPINGYYVFKANPNGLTYKVLVDSELGQLLTNKVAGLAVHQKIPVGSQGTNDAVSLNGGLDTLTNSSNVALVPSAMQISNPIKVNVAAAQALKKKINSYAQPIAQLLTAPPGTKSKYNSNLFTSFINSQVVADNLDHIREQTDNFIKFADSKMPITMKEKVHNHLEQNKNAIKMALDIWADITNLKSGVLSQLNKAAEESSVHGYLDNGQEAHEGFVANGIKFVNRVGFSRQNLSRQYTKEDADSNPTRTIAVYPGRFHPFHRGHAASFKQLAQKYGVQNTYLALSAQQEADRSPFTPRERKEMAMALGIPEKNILIVTSPYKNKDYVTQLKLDPEATRLVFGVSQKDMASDPRFTFQPKKDGSPSYFQPVSKNATEPMSKHAYIDTTDTVDFPIAGKSMRDASSIRAAYAGADEKLKLRILKDLYGQNYAAIKPIFDRGLGGLQEGDNPNFFGFGGGSSSAIPGTPPDLQPHPTKRQIKIAAINARNTKRFTQRRGDE